MGGCGCRDGVAQRLTPLDIWNGVGSNPVGYVVHILRNQGGEGVLENAYG